MHSKKINNSKNSFYLCGLGLTTRLSKLRQRSVIFIVPMLVDKNAMVNISVKTMQTLMMKTCKTMSGFTIYVNEIICIFSQFTTNK